MTESRRTPETISKHIEALRSSHKDHIDLLGRRLSADEGAMYGVDLVVIGVIHRSISLIDGFIKMVEDRNPLCANALLRLQLDNIIRLYACWLVDDPHSIAIRLLEGRPLHRVKSKDGKPLSDAYLTSRASKMYPWIETVYKRTSGFIHLSAPHMMAPVTQVDNSKHMMSIAVGSGGGREWREHEVLESLNASAAHPLRILFKASR